MEFNFWKEKINWARYIFRNKAEVVKKVQARWPKFYNASTSFVIGISYMLECQNMPFLEGDKVVQRVVHVLGSKV